jgi:multidrug efflux pump subunit AcrA (membrane-fusion protein)
MSENLAEAVELLSSGGVLHRLKSEAQAEREAERTGLLVKLVEAEHAERDQAKQAQEGRTKALDEIRRLEAELAQARKTLAGYDHGTIALTATSDKLRARLRKLSDPLYEQAKVELNDLHEKARNAFSTHTFALPMVVGLKPSTHTNALEIAEALSDIRRTQAVLSSMQEAARPDDLENVIESILEPIRLTVRKLNGYR